MATHEETAGNLLNMIYYETRVNVLLQASMSFFILTNNLLKKKVRESPEDMTLKTDSENYSLIVQKFREQVYSTVNYAPGSSSYIQTMSQIMKTLDVLLDYALNYNLVKMPADAGKYSSWGASSYE